MHIFTSFNLGEVEVSNLTILVLVFFDWNTVLANTVVPLYNAVLGGYRIFGPKTAL